MTDAAEGERLRRMVERVTGLPGFTSGIGTEVVAVAAGAVTMALPRRDDLLQVQGHFHGGVISALADHAAGAAVTTAMPPGRFAVTVDLHVNFLAPAQGARLLAQAEAIHVGGTIGVARVDILCGDPGAERTCAIATATLRAVDMPAAGRGVPRS